MTPKQMVKILDDQLMDALAYSDRLRALGGELHDVITCGLCNGGCDAELDRNRPQRLHDALTAWASAVGTKGPKK